VIEDLVKMSFQFVVGSVHFLAKVPSVLRNLLGATQVLGDVPSYVVCDLGQLGIENFRLRGLQVDDVLAGWNQARGRLLGRWGRGLRSRPLAAASLRFGSGAHLSDAFQEFFDFVTHIANVASFRFQVAS
jgi:hypothetical protein